MSQIPTFYPGQELYRNSNETHVRQIMQKLSDSEHYFMGGVFQMTNSKIAEILSINMLPAEIILNGTLYNATKENLHREFESINKEPNLIYVIKNDTREAFSIVTSLKNPEERYEYLKKREEGQKKRFFFWK